MQNLGKTLAQYEEQRFISFHTPGHKGKKEFFTGIKFPEQDLTELPGLDSLHTSLGVIAYAQEKAAEIYGADQSFFLVNGSTVGNQAMFMCLDPGRKVLVERQSHRSVMSALILSGLTPEYIPSVVHPEFHLPLGLDLSNLTKGWGSVQALHLTYPGYYGNLIDLEEVIEKRDLLAPEMPIFVDQAHGSHYLSPLFPKGALNCGADLVVNSTHKTLSALTQAAILHVKGSRVKVPILKQALEMLQSSSPNYLLMTSLERAMEFALDINRWEALYEAVCELHYRLRGILRILNVSDEGKYGINKVDWSKILVNTKVLGLSASLDSRGFPISHTCEPELWDDENILFLLGIGSTPEDVGLLMEGLLSLRDLSLKKDNKNIINTNESLWCEQIRIPPMRYSPRSAFFARKRKIPIKDSVGLVCGESISPYPPGIPLIVMGEEITYEILEILSNPKIRNWQGWEDPSRTIWVIEEE